MRSGIFWLLMVLGSGLSLGVMWLTAIPLGVPGEWTWGRHEITPDLKANLLLGLLAGGAYLTYAAWGARRLARPQCRREECIAWILGLALIAGVWIWTVRGTGATGPTVGGWPYVLYYPGSSGYFYKARYESPRVGPFLANYEALMREGDVLHVGTHPPGLFLFFHGLIGLVDAFPAAVSAINSTQPSAVREAFDSLRVNSEQGFRTGKSLAPPLSTADQAVIWLAALIVLGLSAATVWPLYGFLRHYADRPTSWLCAAAWPLIPAVAIFLPKSDVAYAFFAMLLAWLWISAWRTSLPWRAGLTGGVWSLCLLCSLAFLPVALWLALLSLMESWLALGSGRIPVERQRAVRTIVPAALAVLALLSAFCFWGRIALWNTFWWNYRNHAGFYEENQRTYLTWLWVNPLELACAVGVPVFAMSVTGIGRVLGCRREASRPLLLAPCLTTMIVWGWLWISGKNSGEAARLWIFLMPFLACCCAARWPADSLANESRRWPWQTLLWLGCQMAVCWLTVQRIAGFSLAG